MATWTVTLGNTVSSSGVSQFVVNDLRDTIVAAGEWWDRYIDFGDQEFEILLELEDQGEESVATGGPGSVFFVGTSGQADVFEAGIAVEATSGIDPNGGAPDAVITFNTQELDRFFYDSDPFDRVEPLGSDQIDALTVAIHELGHGFGFIGFADGGTDPALEPDQTVFDTFVDFNNGSPVFVGPSSSAVVGGPVPLDFDSIYHWSSSLFVDGLRGIMNPFVFLGQRSRITPLDVAVFEDLGFDLETASAGDDVVYGYEVIDDLEDLLDGDDFYDGLSGNDTINGGAGDDTLIGGAGIDSLIGGVGADVFVGRMSDLDGDTLADLTFDDSIVISDADLDDDDVTINVAAQTITISDDGQNEITLSFGGDLNNADVTVDEDGGATTITFEAVTLDGDEADNQIAGEDDADDIDGGAGDDSIFGQGGDDTLAGGLGDDGIFGAGGNDLIDGGDGDDSLFGGDGDVGADTIVGGAGDDLVNGGPGDDSVDGGAGNDRVVGDAGDDQVFGGNGDDDLSGDGGDDNVDGGAGDDFLSGGLGDDTLSGGTGNDTFIGQNGADIIFGGEGDDTLFAGILDNASDTLRGGAGNDSLFGFGGSDDLDGGADDDRILGYEGEDTIAGGGGDDILFGGEDADLITASTGDDELSGNQGDDTLFGGDGNDSIFAQFDDDIAYGGAGNDSLFGGGDDGDDTLFGDAGNDTLLGLDGDDELTGGTGADDLRGGDGDDLFIFNSGDGADVIRDFNEGAGAGDVIRLVGVSGVNSFADVMAAASMAGSATLLTFSGGDQLSLEGVAMGDLAADDFLFA